MRATLRMTGAGLIALGGTAVVAALFVPWSWTGSAAAPGPWAWVAILGLGPFTSLAAALPALRRRSEPDEPDRSPWFAAGAALLAGAIAAGILVGIAPERGLDLGGPVAVLGCAALAAGWLLRAAAGRAPARRRAVSVVVALVVVTAVAAGAVPAVGWYTEGRFVRGSVAEALPVVPDAPPERLDRYRWAAPAARFDLLTGPVTAGRHLVLPEGKGIRVLDSVTGRPLWSYERSDIREEPHLAGVTLADGGRMTALSYSFTGGTLVVALDTATGRERWRSRLPRKRGEGVPRLVDGGHVLLLDTSYLGGSLVALNLVDGAPGWRWDTARPEDCGLPRTSVAVSGETVALALRCTDEPDVNAVIGLSAADGGERWRWRPPPSPAGLSLPILASADRIWVAWNSPSGHRGALLDAGTGKATAEHGVPREALRRVRLPLLAGGTVVYPGEPAFGVDAATGRVLWQLTEPAGWTTADAVSHDGVAYLLLIPDTAEDAASALMLLAVDAATGEVRDRQPYDPAGCGATCHHDQRSRVLSGPGLLVVGSGEPDGFRLRGVG